MTSRSRLLLSLGCFAFLVGCADSLKSRRRFLFGLTGIDTPDGKLARAAQLAAQRWQQATGLDIAFTEAPDAPHTIRWEPYRLMPFDDQGERYGGYTYYKDHGYNRDHTLIRIRDDIQDPAYLMEIVTHEMGHVFNPDADHAATGVFSARLDVPGLLIDDASLSRICEELECALFNVETSAPAP